MFYSITSNFLKIPIIVNFADYIKGKNYQNSQNCDKFSKNTHCKYEKKKEVACTIQFLSTFIQKA